MIRTLLWSLWMLLAATTVNAKPHPSKTAYPKMFAHRGCWNKQIPENTPDAVRMAARMGYAGIELDARYTADGVLVVFHDKRINKKLRRAADYSVIKEPTLLSSLTFEQLRNDYVLASPDPAMRQPVATLEEMFQACKACGMTPMLHSNIPASYQLAQEFFGNEWICFTSEYEELLKVRQYSDCLILYSLRKPLPQEVLLDRLQQIGAPCGISTMEPLMLTETFCSDLTSRGYQVQASIFRAPAEMTALRNGITYQLTDFSMAPNPSHTPLHQWQLAEPMRLTAQEPIVLEWDAVECGALTLEITYKGDLTITLNDKRTYHLNGSGKECIGLRFFGTSPSLRITTTSGAKLSVAEALVYSF